MTGPLKPFPQRVYYQGAVWISSGLTPGVSLMDAPKWTYRQPGTTNGYGGEKAIELTYEQATQHSTQL